MKVTPTDDKIQKITRAATELLSNNSPSIRAVVGLVGLMGAYSVASDYGPNHYKNLEIDKIQALKQNRGNYDKKMSVSKLGTQEFYWWLSNIHSLSKDFSVPNWDMTIVTAKESW